MMVVRRGMHISYSHACQGMAEVDIAIINSYLLRQLPCQNLSSLAVHLLWGRLDSGSISDLTLMNTEAVWLHLLPGQTRRENVMSRNYLLPNYVHIY